MKRLLMVVLVLLAATVASGPAHALESAPVSSKRAVATLVTETNAMEPGKPFRVGLRLRMADGWHTYWKNPGDAGVPPDLTIEGASQSPIDWPTPRRVAEGPVMTYAYLNEVLLPVTVTAQTGTIKAHAQWLVCKDICVPEESDFSLTLPVGIPSPSAQAGLFAAHDRAVPRTSPWSARIAPDGTLFVQGPELTPATVTDAWFIPDQPEWIQDDAAQPLSVRMGGFTLALKPAKGFDATKDLTGVLSVRDRTGMQTDVVVDAVPGPPPPEAMPPLAQILVFAFLGGLILNLMPCVFPILAMKAVSLAGHAGRGRAHAVAYTAGVLVTFVALAAGLLVARAAGTAAGWGFQFSSPVFVAAMTWLLFAVGLNLSGVFQIGAGLTGAGSGLAGRHGTAGSFFTGLLAVLVATPCTAPFMGVAVAAGLAAPPVVTLLVFAVMGLGLSAPYIAFASMPVLVRLMPRPGRWMEVLKQALAFPMYGAAAWLVWVVSQEAGSAGVLGTAAGLVLIGFAGWVFGATQAASVQPRRFGQAMALVAVLAAGAVLSGIRTVPVGTATEALAEAYSPERLAALRAAGKPVFVNMTAAWCVTCLVNERVAISTDAVRSAFAERNVAYLKGDWTRQDPAITAFLRQNGRDGVPLYVFFPGHGGGAEVLPQILTEGEVLRVLRAS
ncbi:MAG TPA: cytochrome C biogenesis protein [Acetobacteraceae bacterium]|jgi:thiol:disulfide interchange protein/DsbC/DsbD-like thiol-disulfide interchange protein|nr:cytochrome C biogenesis protein [Acetobacteraceae bacterium]